MKLQDAYVAETGTTVGDWSKIGYNMPASNNFTYEEDALKGGSALLTELSNGKIGWKTKNNAKLNDCVAGSYWTITLAEATAASTAPHLPILPPAIGRAAADASCSVMPASFANAHMTADEQG